MSASSTPPKRLRCAIYTRKSSSEGLDQSFNSLDAQREASEAYVKSQAAEGWIALSTPYDDGGFSGGSMDRPALTRLLSDIAAGKVDVVVVYKIDRLTRALADFAKIVEAFDAKGVSFVSVTQAFNTTTSMGRLTLNVLLSFAQFEREVTGERIRDKIAASKKKGMWMGGALPLGYDAPTDPVSRALVINPAEAETVRHVFRRYLDLGSVHALCVALESEGVRSKVRVTQKGRVTGGAALGRGALFHLLKNRAYLGDMVHRDQAYPGAHPPIVDAATFEAANALLADHRVQRAASGDRGPPLTGKLFDGAGRPLSPTTASGKGGRYRYYVLTDIQKGGMAKLGDTWPRRLPAAALDTHVLAILRRLSGRMDAGWADLAPLLVRLEARVEDCRLHLNLGALSDDPLALIIAEITARLRPDEAAALSRDGETLVVVCPGRLLFRGGRVWREGGVETRRVNPAIVSALKRAHRLAARHGLSPQAVRRGAAVPANPHERNLCRLAFLAPDIQTDILAGRQPPTLTLAALLDPELPSGWRAQREALKFGGPSTGQ